MLRHSTVRRWLLSLVGIVLLFNNAVADNAPDYAAAIAQLPAASYAEKNDIVRKLAQLQQPGTKALLTAFLDSDLYVRSSDNKVFIIVANNDAYKLTDAITQQVTDATALDGFDKIGANNQLRKALRNAIAQFDLTSASAETSSPSSPCLAASHLFSSSIS